MKDLNVIDISHEYQLNYPNIDWNELYKKENLRSEVNQILKSDKIIDYIDDDIQYK